MDYMDDKEMDAAVNLINLSAKRTFPEVTEEIDSWLMKNFMVIMPKIISMCSPDAQPTDDENRKDALAEKIKNAQSTEKTE